MEKIKRTQKNKKIPKNRIHRKKPRVVRVAKNKLKRRYQKQPHSLRQIKTEV